MKFDPHTHDLSLSSWGPYTKKYAGISHIGSGKDGIRFDLSVFPGFYRRRVDLPNVLMEGNYHVWEAAPDLSYYSTRHELEWKDEVYCDIAYVRPDEHSCLIRSHCVNNGQDVQNLVLHYMASIQYPNEGNPLDPEWITPVSCERPPKSVFCRAIDYERITRKELLPTDQLVPDGRRPNEVRGAGFCGGSGVRLGKTPGERLEFTLETPELFLEPVLILRYRSEKAAQMRADGNLTFAETLPIHSVLETFAIRPACYREGGKLRFALSLTEGEILLDSLVLCEKEDADAVCYRTEEPAWIPECWEMGSEKPLDWKNQMRLPLEKDASKETDTSQNTLVLKYPHDENYYGIYWDFPDFCLRYLLTDELDIYLRYMAHNHVSKVLTGNGKGHFSNVFLRPIPVKPGTSLDLYGAVCCGKTREEVQRRLAGWIARRPEFPAICDSLRKNVSQPAENPEGECYRFSQERMMATTLTNVVYPVYTKRSYIRHNTPGRWWDSLYTWDSGFVGLGLSACEIQRAADCLNAYLTEPGDPETAFLHHGSPVPVQFYLFQELYNKTQSRELLEACYPRLLQYYRFMTGQLGSSTIGKFSSNILCTWDYFYNSGGWDDYPPQVAVHAQKLESSAAPTVTTSHMIRCAKIMKLAAEQLGAPEEDCRLFERDIQRFEEALQQYCWDEESGYFGYLRHDEKGNPLGIFRHASGQNFNMGLDGASPMLAGILTDSQLERITGHLMSERELWTPIGLSTVDQSANYYKKDGYWNGAVWMPHQWFFFKALLDYGKADEAFRVAKTGLDVWANEVDASYNCFEHFIIASGRGAGWHHFSGLSTPVLLWYASYFRPGTITGGNSAWIEQQEWSSNQDALRCRIRFSDTRRETVLVFVLKQGKAYRCRVNGTEAVLKKRFDGTYELRLSPDAGECFSIEIFE
ncbi:MAG: MGH1-like glycoside hydrolase domain-containing protein [Candidatus Merdivicinus sp.]